ncbi:MAG: glycosyltransferase family 2 protein [Porticoccus sp.]|nr:glycosyltransferase family 2 protein [Porticoccus sp.]
MNTTEPLFSVVIPCYNYGHSIGRAIESVLNQQGGHSFDVTVINDGSSDNSATVISEYEKKYPNVVRYVYQQNSGLAATRNRGVNDTTGQYLIFLDADDELTVEALTIFFDAIAANPEACLIVGGHHSRHENGKYRYHSPGKLPKDAVEIFHTYLRNKLGLANGAVAMKRCVFDRVRYNPALRQSEDIPVFAAILANYPSVMIDKATAIIYRHEGSLRSNTMWADKMGFLLVDEVFKHSLPAGCYQYECWYRSQKGLSLFRMYFLAGKNQEAENYYHQAIRQYPKNIFRWTYLRKYLKMRFNWTNSKIK